MSTKKENIRKMYDSLRSTQKEDFQEQLKSEIKNDSKVKTMLNIVHKVAKNATFSEFYDFAIDEKNIPAVKLTSKEMELVAGGMGPGWVVYKFWRYVNPDSAFW